MPLRSYQITQKHSIVYSQANCQPCKTVKQLLSMYGYIIEERLIGEDGFTKQDLLKDVPNARGVPQVLIDGKLIGGLIEVSTYLRKNDTSSSRV